MEPRVRQVAALADQRIVTQFMEYLWDEGRGLSRVRWIGMADYFGRKVIVVLRGMGFLG